MKAFFPDVNHLDKEGLNSYPKAVNMPKIIGKVVSLNTFKHKADKLVLYFFYDPFFWFLSFNLILSVTIFFKLILFCFVFVGVFT